MDLVGINISLIPVPGLENTTVEPIPTPNEVPNAIESAGLKYNSLLYVRFLPILLVLFLKIKFLGLVSKLEVAVWADPIVELWFLKTLSLLSYKSTFNTFTCSVPIPKTSLGLTLNVSEILPLTLKKVTRPVAPAELIPTSKENLFVVTPAVTVWLLVNPLVLNPLMVRYSDKMYQLHY